MNKPFLLLFSVLLIPLCLSAPFEQLEESLKLQITEPSSLASLFVHSKMDYTVADMGNIPFDTHLNGHLQQAYPLDGCSRYTNQHLSPIYMVQRSNCSFVQKQKYAQMAGAKLLIVADNVVEEEKGLLLTPDNATTSYDVPLIMISKYDANLITPYLMSTKESDIVNLHVSFPKMKHQSLSRIDMWVAANDYLSLQVVEDLQRVQNYEFILDTQVVMHVHYVYYQCKSCQRTGFMQPYQDCLCGGRYCFSTLDSEENDAIQGTEIVQENLKQSCLYKVDFGQYTEYIQHFREECFRDRKLIKDFVKCGEEQEKWVLWSDIEKTRECVKNSYTNPNDIYGRGDNTMMAEAREKMKQYDINSFPLAIINGVEYKGTFHGPHMIRTICQSFKLDSLPEHCKEYIFTKDHYQNMMNSAISHFPYFKFTVLLLIVLAVYFYFYRRSLKIELKREMELQVSSAISQYHALGDTANTSQRL